MKLIKIKLINWHFFNNETINVKDNILITGENGCGKSTLTDAIYYVLSGGDDKNFNKAANVNAKRTLSTYIRCKLGNEGDGKEYLRNENDIISHIALEYVNDNNYHMVLGCVLELTDVTNVDSNFYVIQNHSINDEDFIDNNQILEYTSFKNRLKSRNIQFDDNNFNISKAKRRDIICRDILKLGNNDKYLKLLKDAITFKPINEVSTFVNTFLLEESNINIESLMDELRNYQEIKNELDKQRDKLQALETFIGEADKYDKNSKKMSYLQALETQSTINKLKKGIVTGQRELQKIDAIINQNNESILDLEGKITKFNIELANLNANDLVKDLVQKEQNLISLKKEIEGVENSLRQVELHLKNEKNIITRFGFKYDFRKDIDRNDFISLKNHFFEYENEVMATIKKLNLEKWKKETEKNQCEQQINDISEQISNLNVGKNTYGKIVDLIIGELKSYFKASYKKDIEVKPLCEYIEITDNNWTDAIEGYLEGHKFDIVIAPEYFDEAIKVYDHIKTEHQIHSVGIINCNLKEFTKLDADTLFDKVEVENKYAKSAVYTLLSDVYCVDDISELCEYDKAITCAGIMFKDQTLRNINPESYRIPYLGKRSMEKRKNLLENEKNKLELKISDLKESINNISQDLDVLNSSKIGDLKNINNLWEKNRDLGEQLDDVITMINKFKENPDIMSIYDRIDEVKNKLDQFNSDKKKMESDNDSIKFSKGEKTGALNRAKYELDENEKELDIRKKGLIEVEYQNIMSAYFNNNVLDLKNIMVDLNRLEKENKYMEKHILNGMRMYINDFGSALFADLSSIQDYLKLYNDLKDNQLYIYVEKANEALDSCYTSFKIDFISKLSNKIERAKKELSQINKKLNTIPFGSDEEIYQFSYYPSDDEEMKEYYNIITSGKVLEVNSLLDEELSDKDRDIIRRLFDNIIVNNNDVESETKIAKYLDYRNYMKYDITIKNKNGDLALFSKINREKSGGETQTPFYVIIAACFDRLMKRDGYQESTCTVIYDEAFNNMDESRIHALMNFYKKLNIQLIVVVPSNRMPILASYMDTIIGLLKNNNRVYVIPME